MANYNQLLSDRIKTVGHGICVGLDPIITKIPRQFSIAEDVYSFYENMLNAFIQRKITVGVVKPNIAFYEALGIDALFSLQKIIKLYKSEGILVILDAKRGDIGKTSEAYAQMAYDVYHSDAITVAPYMGADSIRPFQESSAKKGVYILCRTSNIGSSDFQSLILRDFHSPLYIKIAQKIMEWTNGDLGAVIGATAPDELDQILSVWDRFETPISCLIPGISVKKGEIGQGGDLETVIKILNQHSHSHVHLVNSSSGINYALDFIPENNPAVASAIALEILIEKWHKTFVYK